MRTGGILHALSSFTSSPAPAFFGFLSRDLSANSEKQWRETRGGERNCQIMHLHYENPRGNSQKSGCIVGNPVSYTTYCKTPKILGKYRYVSISFHETHCRLLTTKSISDHMYELKKSPLPTSNSWQTNKATTYKLHSVLFFNECIVLSVWIQYSSVCILR